MDIAKLTSKGQLTLPIKLRKKLGLETGDQIAFVEKNGDIIVVAANRLQIAEQHNIEGVIATLGFENLTISDEMKNYADKRIQGKISYQQEREILCAKYLQKAEMLND